jgi:hypothetical protein
MNIALRKLALLEKNLLEKEEYAKLNGLSSVPEELAFRGKLTDILDKVRKI